MSDIDFITINPAEDEAALINIYEKETDTVLEQAQDARILIQMIVYMANLLKVQFNEAAKLNLVEYSRYPILDFLGDAKNCKRLKDEQDASYIKRILLSPEGFSVAGPELAYIYFAKSAHPDIVDVSVDAPDENATVKIGNITAEMTEATVENSNFTSKINYENEEIEITLKQALSIGDKIKVKIPHPYKINIYTLTKDGAAGASVLNSVKSKLDGVRPLCDYVNVLSASVSEFTISGTVYMKKKADETTVKTLVTQVLNDFLTGLKNVLNKSVVRNQIITKVCSIEGVHDFALTILENNLPAQKNINYKGSVDSITYERVNYD